MILENNKNNLNYDILQLANWNILNEFINCIAEK